MRHLHHPPRTGRRTSGPPSVAPALHTYQQIAEILAQRNGGSISPTRVRRMCEVAEAKLVDALLADPLILRELAGRKAAR